MEGHDLTSCSYVVYICTVSYVLVKTCSSKEWAGKGSYMILAGYFDISFSLMVGHMFFVLWWAVKPVIFSEVT